MATMTDIEAQVAAMAGVVNSAVALLTAIHTELVAALANTADPSAMQKVLDDMKAQTDALAAAVATNPDPAVAPAP